MVALAIEYRHIANGYLSTQHAEVLAASVTDPHETAEGTGLIKLSPCKDVNDMLIADKIQNRKDFELFHAQEHPKRHLLDSYFRAWLQRLTISEEQYQEVKLELLVRVYGKDGANTAREHINLYRSSIGHNN